MIIIILLKEIISLTEAIFSKIMKILNNNNNSFDNNSILTNNSNINESSVGRKEEYNYKVIKRIFRIFLNCMMKKKK